MKEEQLPLNEIGRDDLEEIYGWSLEDALKAQEEWREKNPTRPRGPLYRWIAAQSLEELRQKFEGGELGATLDALFQCSMDGLPIPKWCAMAYIEAYREVRHYRAKSWDDVFGKPHPKGTNLAAKRKERKLKHIVWSRIHDIKQRRPETPIDAGLFESVGEELGLGKTLTEEYYYSAKKQLSGPS